MIDGQEERNRRVLLSKFGASGAVLAFMIRNKRPKNMIFKSVLPSKTLKVNLADVKTTT